MMNHGWTMRTLLNPASPYWNPLRAFLRILLIKSYVVETPQYVSFV